MNTSGASEPDLASVESHDFGNAFISLDPEKGWVDVFNFGANSHYKCSSRYLLPVNLVNIT